MKELWKVTAISRWMVLMCGLQFFKVFQPKKSLHSWLLSLDEVHTSLNRNTLGSKLKESTYLQCLSAVLCTQKE